jgi:hypothetical protein
MFMAGAGIVSSIWFKNELLPHLRTPSRRCLNAINCKDDIPKGAGEKLTGHDKKLNPEVTKDIAHDASPSTMDASPEIRREVSPDLVESMAGLDDDFRHTRANSKGLSEDFESMRFSSSSASASKEKFNSTAPAMSAPAAEDRLTDSAPEKSSSAPAISSHSAPATKPSTRRR